MSKGNKEDFTSSVVIEMLVVVGIPWEEDLSCFWAAAQILLLNSVRCLCITKVGASKVEWNSFQNSNSFRFVHFNSFLSLHGVTVNEGVCV